MKGFFRRISPKAAVSDFKEQWEQETPHRWPILGLAMALTFFIFMMFLPDAQRIVLPRPEINYVATFAEDRTDAEIIASNCANQELKDELEARLAASEQSRREVYQALGRATFVDVEDAIAEAEAQRQAELEEMGVSSEEELAALEAASVEEYCSQVVAPANAG